MIAACEPQIMLENNKKQHIEPREKLQEIVSQLEEVRLSILDPRAQGFLFSAQAQLASYLMVSSDEKLPRSFK